MNELKPCPFCGCEDILVKKRKTTMIECADCGVVAFDVQNGMQRDPFLLWNTRSDADAQAEIARLRVALETIVRSHNDPATLDLPPHLIAQYALR